MNRCLTVLFHLAVLSGCAGGPEPGSSASSSPADFWLMERGKTLISRAALTIDGQLAYRKKVTAWSGGPTRLEGREAQRLYMVFKTMEPEESEPHPPMLVFQVVDDSLSSSVARQFYGGDVLVDEWPYVDLAAPLVQGHTWEFRTMRLSNNPHLPIRVETRMISTIEEVGLTVEVPAGVFEGCLEVTERCREEGVLRLQGGPREGQSVTLEWETTRYWAPGLGGIRERSVQTVTTVRKPSEVLYRREFDFELVAIRE